MHDHTLKGKQTGNVNNTAREPEGEASHMVTLRKSNGKKIEVSSETMNLLCCWILLVCTLITRYCFKSYSVKDPAAGTNLCYFVPH